MRRYFYKIMLITLAGVLGTSAGCDNSQPLYGIQSSDFVKKQDSDQPNDADTLLNDNLLNADEAPEDK